MMPKRRSFIWLAWGFGAALLAPGLALAAPAHKRAADAVSEVESAAAQLAPAPQRVKKKSVATLIAEAELHLRTEQYDAAIDKLNQVIELRAQGRGSNTTDADAHFLLGEAYFATEQMYSARRYFRIVTEQADDPAYAGFGAPAASRLVDITLRIHRTEDLADVVTRVDRMLARGEQPGLLYARGKALFAMGRYAESEEQASRVDAGSEYGQRAAYLRGTALMKLAQSDVSADSAEGEVDRTAVNYRQAIAAFEQAAVVSGELARAQRSANEVSDLSWLAVARLHYESGDYQRAAVAYQKIQRESKYFAEALFEAAWTYVRLGDYQRGQRALEALAVLDPGLIDGADGELLRGDLLLRQGRFDEAQSAYEQVRAKYQPLHQQVSRYLDENPDPSTYYDKLTAVDIEIGNELPDLAIDWAREEAEEERIFAIVDDVARSRNLINRSRRIVTLLRASLASNSRAKVFPEILKQLEDVVGLLNQLSVARLSLARGMDEVSDAGSGELGTVRRERRRLMAQIGRLPTNPGDFSVRQDRAQKSWNQVSQSLQRLQLQADHLRALVNGLHRVLLEAERYGVQADSATIERYRAEIVENEKDLAVYTRRIEGLREQVEMGRVQSGLGDESFESDEASRNKFNDLFEKEVELAARSSASKEANFAREASPILARIVVIEGRLESLRGQLDDSALARGREMQRTLAVEADAIEVYASRLDTMDEHARLLVGEVAKHNFLKARDRIKNVVMRADIGLVQQAWEVREEQKHRVRDLLRERAQEERFINDELREVLDDEEALQ